MDSYSDRMSSSHERVVRILGVGVSPEDGVTRISKGAQYACLRGSESEHQLLQAFCADLQALLDSLGIELNKLHPDELQALILAHGLHEGRECAS